MFVKYILILLNLISKTKKTMRDLVWLIVVILIIGWLVGYFAFPDIGSLIHILLVLVVILVIYKLLTGRRL
ncbi:hypothetical protein ULMS_26230 [Patiriisocius marinistellae]|uniref:Lmo0937 family membrane protein n=2 Tax=Patiriisocius marinistellae TaxID=2494560 RepID=A0A5J4G340_9FLAO|nr:hypothetical protein ULMS_26230 [Patiriisocius marinistellae]